MKTPETMTSKEKLKLTKDQAREIVGGDNEEFTTIQDNITGHGRWTVHHDILIKRVSDGKFFKGYYSVGATEQQDEQPFEYTEPNFNEVHPVEKTVIVYE